MSQTQTTYLLTPALLLAAFGGGYATSLATQGATARASITDTQSYVFTGTAEGAARSLCETVGAAALAHANHADRLDDALSDDGGCPIEHIHLTCDDSSGAAVWSWEYRTEEITWTRTPGAPD